MKIEKRKVTESSKLSGIAKSAAASALGMATLFSLSACIESDPVSAYNNSNISSSGTTGSINSSSSSSNIESSSSATNAESSSSEPTKPSRLPLSSSSALAGIMMTSSSRFVIPQSSSEKMEPLAGDPIIIEGPESSSSSAEPESSSSSQKQFPITRDSITVPNIHLCEDPGCPGVLIDSMVTTFEMTDIQV